MTRVALTIGVLLAWAAPASASQLLLRDQLVVPTAVEANCSGREYPGEGVAAVQLTARSDGYLTARLAASSGDWDLAVFRRSGGVPVAASAYRGATEVASGFVRRGDRLTVHACRRSGRARTARLGVSLERMAAQPPRATQRLVRVATPTDASRQRLATLGLDLTERGGPRFVWVLLHGERDAARLRSAALAFTALRRPERRIAQTAALPSGHTSNYRRLADYGNEMRHSRWPTPT